ncbi:MAG TPA: hypothetical protein VGP88_04955 [Thermoplasmata archaeon]|jgi:hypothetical protein|nr:hypothetical protein [Thermoplasmata archaeon]
MSTRTENAVRSLFSTVLLIVGILVLLFGVFLAFEARAITWPAIIDFAFGAVLVIVSSWI